MTESGSPTSPGAGPSFVSQSRRKLSGAGRKASIDAADHTNDNDEARDGSGEAGFGDDFDDFEEGAEDAEFDDFNDDFQEPEIMSPPSQSMPILPSFVSIKLHTIRRFHITVPPHTLTNILPSRSWTSNWILQRKYKPQQSLTWTHYFHQTPLTHQSYHHCQKITLYSLPNGVPHSGPSL